MKITHVKKYEDEVLKEEYYELSKLTLTLDIRLTPQEMEKLKEYLTT